jgi:hypothetical protein
LLAGRPFLFSDKLPRIPRHVNTPFAEFYRVICNVVDHHAVAVYDLHVIGFITRKETDVVATVTSPKAKVRSPNYPVISLGEAVERLQTIWEHQHRHPTDRTTIARLLGYGTLNGASMALISALTKYGLLESAGRDQLRVSPMGVDVLVHQPGEPERAEAIQTAAFMPTLFHDLQEQFGGDPPSDLGLKSYLIKRGFNPRTVDGVIRSYRDTLAFVAEEAAETDVESEDELDPEVPPMPAMMPVEAPGSYGEPIPVHARVIPADQQTVRRLSVPLSRNVTAEVVFQGGDVTPRELDALRTYVDVWKSLLLDSDSPDDGEGERVPEA